MKHHRNSGPGSVLTSRAPPRIAVVGAGIAGLSCARELRLRGYEAVVFEASDRLGGRCSSRSTRIGLFDDGAQCISGAIRLASYVQQRPGELAALHSWTVPTTPAEDERSSKDWHAKEDEEGNLYPQLRSKLSPAQNNLLTANYSVQLAAVKPVKAV